MSAHARDRVNWRYAICPMESAPARFGPFADIVARWRQGCPGPGLAPPRDALDFFDVIPWLGRVSIARIERDPFAVRFTLWGTALSQWWGVDYTNRTLGSRAKNPELWEEGELAYFAAMDRSPFIGFAFGYLDQYDRSHIKVIGLDLPMARADGMLSHVFSIHMKVGLDETPESLLPDCPIASYF
jgi:hypothetical protein